MGFIVCGPGLDFTTELRSPGTFVATTFHVFFLKFIDVHFLLQFWWVSTTTVYPRQLSYKRRPCDWASHGQARGRMLPS